MADHLDAPGLMPPGGDPSIDITDVYAFQKPGDADKSIVMLNVNPLTLSAAFNAVALYELKVDTNGDARPDVAFRFKFGAFDGSSQRAWVRRATGGRARGGDFKGDLIISDAPVSFGSDPMVTVNGAYKFFAGRRSDPFFFDLKWFLAGLPLPRPPELPPTDFFLDKNVFGIALEMPKSALQANSLVGIWGRTLLPEDEDEDEDDDDRKQIDRMGRPAINTVFNKGKDKVRFNRGKPDKDRKRFGDNFVHVLESFGYDEATATAIMKILLPDMLTYDPSSGDGFLNGRKLTDDVIDIELGIVTNGARTTDGVGVHTDLLDAFPYMGTPH